MNPSQLAGLIVTAGTALAGLILIFLGGVFTAFEGYDPQAKNTVRGKYIKRAAIAYAGFIAAIVAVACGITGVWFGGFAYVGLVWLVVAGIASLAAATLSVTDLFQ